MDMLAIGLRFGTYIILSLIAGVPLFLWLSLGVARGAEVFRPLRPIYAALLVIGASLTIVTLFAATAAMAGTALLPVDWDMVKLVLAATASGKAIVARALLLIAALPFALTISLRGTALLAALAAATLIWSGHAAGSEGAAGWLHLFADMVHILAAALWIGGMACLLLALGRARDAALPAMLESFALIGTLAVALLVGTGIVNAVMIVGLDALPHALGTLYGRLLALKIAAFLAMLCLAANNRFRLTPFYGRDAIAARPAMRRSIGMEMLLALLVLLLVGWLGMIDPAGAA